MMRTIVWFRGKDLRLTDNHALHSALSSGEAIPVFIVDPSFLSPQSAQKAPHRVQFLLESLQILKEEFSRKGGQLFFAYGRPEDVLPKLAIDMRANRVVTQNWVDPRGRLLIENIKKKLTIPLEIVFGETLQVAGTTRSAKGEPFAVFTPFARAFREQVSLPPPLPAPEKISPWPINLSIASVFPPTLEQLGITKNSSLLKGGELAAKKRLQLFLEKTAFHYHENRDRLDDEGTSRLSADLALGTLSIHYVWHEAEKVLAVKAPAAWEAFSRELLWREFTHDMLWHRPQLTEKPFRHEFEKFPWQKNEDHWQAWKEGFTGYPIVDAAARQLLQEGFVHNRARMISASFLTKHLLISYQEGEAHYFRYLTDGDVAQNNAGWQWSAGCGCDAQPYFRVFNPTLQGEKFDITGAYVRRFVPELALLPSAYIHRPWEAPKNILEKSGVILGKTYPAPIVEHSIARQQFLSIAAQIFKKTPLKHP